MSHYVYFMQFTPNLFKAGITSSLYSRISTLQTSRVEKIVIYQVFECTSRENALQLEQWIHSQAKARHVLRRELIQTDNRFIDTLIFEIKTKLKENHPDWFVDKVAENVLVENHSV